MTEAAPPINHAQKGKLLAISSFNLRRFFSLAGLAVLAWLLYRLTWDLRPFPIYTPVDDWKYLADAANIASGNWLGPYIFETLTKRPMFSISLALAHLAGMPFMLFLYSLHFAACTALAWSFRRLGYSRPFCWVLLVLSLFMPMCFDHEATRVIRDFFYVSMQTLLLAAAQYFISLSPEHDSRRKRRIAFLVFCLILAWHYGTREEYMLYWPVIGALFLYHLTTRTDLGFRQKSKYAAVMIAVALTFVSTTGFIVRYLNYKNYGVFLLIEHEEGTFPKMIGRIASVNEGPTDSKLLIDWEEREKLARVLPRFRPLHRVLSTPLYDTSPRCQIEGKCESFDFSHQIYVIRSSLQLIGCPMNGRGTELCFRSFTNELERACHEKLISCEQPLRKSMLPPLHRRLWGEFGHFLAMNSSYLSQFRHRGMPRQFKTDDSPEIVSKFEEFTLQRHYRVSPEGQLFGAEPATIDVLRDQLTRREKLGQAYMTFGPLLTGLAGLALVFQLAGAARARRFRITFELALCAGLLATIVARILLISYISAADNYMGPNYLTPAHHSFLIVCLVLVYRFAVSAARAPSVARIWSPISARLRSSK